MDAVHFFTKRDRTLLVGQWAKRIPDPFTGIKLVIESSHCFRAHKFLHQDHCLFPDPRRAAPDYRLLFPSLVS